MRVEVRYLDGNGNLRVSITSDEKRKMVERLTEALIRAHLQQHQVPMSAEAPLPLRP